MIIKLSIHITPTMNLDFPDPVLTELLLRRRRIILSSNTRINAAVQAATLILTNETEDKEPVITHGGSKPGKRPNLARDFEGSYQRLMEHYLCAEPLYPEETFRRRFRMNRPLFMRIAGAIEEHDPYFTHRPNALGKWGLRPIVKITAALRMLSYGGAADCNDEYLQISESTSLESMDRFCNAVVELYQDEYLRQPSIEDLERLLLIGAKRGFPEMLGSIDCMHWQWKNCPSGWAGQLQGKEKVLSLLFLKNQCLY